MFAQINSVDADKHKKVWNMMSSLLSWNNEQKNVLHNDDKFHDEICLFEDFFNIRKTKVLVMLMLIYLLCSFHIILMTLMRVTSDNEAQNIAEFIKHDSNIKQFKSIQIYCLLMKTHKLHKQSAVIKDVMMIIKSDVHLFKLFMKMKKNLNWHSYNLINMSLHTRIIKQAQKQTSKDVLFTLYLSDLEFMKQESLNKFLKMNMWLKFQKHLILLCETALYE